ncbi:hypothetical protein TCAL_06079 [Tigriopus californicus]|uniref:glutathione transferase n=1 Tax=Tigriopus californicus TaxID=6832 RepID=A0A553P206_TIGCA|nr:glutathione S-transferase Mu 1-like [Tigriopus californicus]TRY71716.1 hypothetical protein TCAL_06079 [Tigriopus californicus]|eukprot:TCALIF_06079-PA protein Name:"Similar to GSTM1 Glutathione S-transferase Mu 1 (Bos taurus)" AED:0.37 eAED:0.37 QI:0/0/0/1/1/1/2/0/244
MSVTSKAILGYWDCRGLCHASRLVLEYAQVSYEFRPAQSGPGPLYAKKVWLDKKFEVLSEFDFPNLPYYQDENVKLTQSMAILQYLGRRYGLAAENEKAQIHLDLFREQINELFGALTSYVYFGDHIGKGTKPSAEEKNVSREAFLKKCNADLPLLEKKKSKIPGPWLTGDKLTYVDFHFYEALDHIRKLVPGILNKCPHLSKVMDQFEKLPFIQDYLGSDRFRPFPLWSERSSIGLKEGDYET